ncbi:uncharacterized protein LOC135827131 [Sycon ciliatum]|uniref:uncharacterized protein LOC135827131 n=1 Tax=Sycon ciliatum TaxID=27933 RepID=UPI0031F6EDDF
MEARQEGPLYYQTPRKVQLFGVCCEAQPRQINYLLDETDTIGCDGKRSHNPNTVASLLHHYFQVHGLHEEECVLHADNCAGQNKNRTIMTYLAWRCLTGLHKKISLSFMITGHTRCLVDCMFGLLKQRYRRADCYTMGQLCDVVNSSSICNAAQTIPGSGLVLYEWDTFFEGLFRPIPQVSKQHHFLFSCETPGIVDVKKLVDDNFTPVAILKTAAEQVQAAGLPNVLPPGGMSRERQTYLYKEIRPYVADQWQDEVCPAPPPL